MNEDESVFKAMMKNALNEKSYKEWLAEKGYSANIMNLNDRLAANLLKAKEQDHLFQDSVIVHMGSVVSDWYRDLSSIVTDQLSIYHKIPYLYRHYTARLIDELTSVLKRVAGNSHRLAVEAILDSLTEEEAQRLLKPFNVSEAILGKIAGGILGKTRQLLLDNVFTPLTDVTKLSLIAVDQVVDAVSRAVKGAASNILLSIVTNAHLNAPDGVDIAKEFVKPVIQIVKANIERSTRTYAAYVANKANMVAYERLGTALIGFQHNSIIDERSRPWHAKRDGSSFFLNPEDGQRGMEDCMVVPPLEPISRWDVPADAPAIAYSCRCWLTPILNLENP
jgi:hypothetical protein